MGRIRGQLNPKSKVVEILKLLDENGPMTRGQIAEHLSIKPIVYVHDFEDMKRRRKLGELKYPPRRNTTVYPYLPGALNYMSRKKEFKTWTGTQEEFERFHQPLIKYNQGKWEITTYGQGALNQL